MSEEATMSEIRPVRVEVTVRRPQPEAFRVFTEDMARWWPLATHSVGRDKATTCHLEGRVGGRLFERLEDGSEEIWGQVLTWDPPGRVSFTWHPGRAPETAQDVEVSFHPAGDGATRVELVHRGWERYGEGAAEMRDNYESGWGHVLGECYSGAAVTA